MSISDINKIEFIMSDKKRSIRLYTIDEIITKENWSDNTELISNLLLICFWIEKYLTKPHSDLGRKGPVCPYTGPSLDRKTFFITHIDDARVNKDKVIDFMIELKDVFLAIEPTHGNDTQYKTILTIFPNLTEDEFHLIDEVQQDLKLEFIKSGLMLGQFHKKCNEGGVKNPDFRPLKSPIPLLAIRQIIAEDIVFMKNPDTRKYDIDYIEAYFKTFANELPVSLVREVVSKLVEA